MDDVNLGRTGLKVSRKHIFEAVAATRVKLSDEEIQHLNEPYQPHPVLGPT